MRNLESCERCDGSGADPRQELFSDEIVLCIACFGDGCFVTESFTESPLRLSA